MFLKDPFTGNPSIPFTLYAMECEGELDTEVGRRNRLLKNLRALAVYSPLDLALVRQEADKCGLGNLTESELVDIMWEAYR